HLDWFLHRREIIQEYLSQHCEDEKDLTGKKNEPLKKEFLDTFLEIPSRGGQQKFLRQYAGKIFLDFLNALAFVQDAYRVAIKSRFPNPGEVWAVKHKIHLHPEVQ